MQSEKLSDIALDRVPDANETTNEVEVSRSRSPSTPSRRSQSRSNDRERSNSRSRSRSRSHRHDSKDRRSRSSPRSRRGSTFESRRGDQGSACGFEVINRPDLENVFKQYGSVTDIHIPRDYYTHEQRGFAFIEYDSREAAEDAISHVDNTQIAGYTVKTTRGVPLAAITVITAITVTTVRTAIVRVAVPAIVTVVKSRIAESLLVAIVLHRVVIALRVATALRLAMMPCLLTTMPPFLAMIARSLASGHPRLPSSF
ncbi:hypothetical protein WA588_000582 [Blastocystis sp. NMH]